MSKQITAAELAEIVTNILSGDSGELDSIQAHEGFMTDIAKVVCDYCGGEVHHNASPMEDTWYVGIHGNDSLPADGGVWRDYDQEGALFDEAEVAPSSEALKYATGDWMHPFSDNTRLIAEAGTVFHNTGLSPVQLVEMVKELKAASKHCEDLLTSHEINRVNGEELADTALAMLRAALAKCEGVKP